MQEKEPFRGSGSHMAFMQAKNEMLIMESIEKDWKSITQITREVRLSSFTVRKRIKNLLEDDLAIQKSQGTKLMYKLKET
jgi:predicted transcriptional regulator